MRTSKKGGVGMCGLPKRGTSARSRVGRSHGKGKCTTPPLGPQSHSQLPLARKEKTPFFFLLGGGAHQGGAQLGLKTILSVWAVVKLPVSKSSRLGLYEYVPIHDFP